MSLSRFNRAISPFRLLFTLLATPEAFSNQRVGEIYPNKSNRLQSATKGDHITLWHVKAPTVPPEQEISPINKGFDDVTISSLQAEIKSIALN